jgi:hypothetical protein
MPVQHTSMYLLFNLIILIILSSILFIILIGDFLYDDILPFLLRLSYYPLELRDFMYSRDIYVAERSRGGERCPGCSTPRTASAASSTRRSLCCTLYTLQM